MSDNSVVIVVGMGEVGSPLSRILSKHYEVVGIDVEPEVVQKPCSVLHVCYPFQIRDFAGTTLEYCRKYKPSLVIINSTVAPGTTRKIQMLLGDTPVAYSPVRGKHVRMEAEMLHYKKFVAACTADVTAQAEAHFLAAGVRTDRFRTPEVAELSKLLETTALGILVAWAQEVERFAAQYDATFDEVNAFIKEIDFLPSNIFPGVIGGHCVMPNIALLQTHFKSQFLDAIVDSNKRKQEAERPVALNAGGLR